MATLAYEGHINGCFMQFTKFEVHLTKINRIVRLSILATLVLLSLVNPIPGVNRGCNLYLCGKLEIENENVSVGDLGSVLKLTSRSSCRQHREREKAIAVRGIRTGKTYSKSYFKKFKRMLRFA